MWYTMIRGWYIDGTYNTANIKTLYEGEYLTKAEVGQLVEDDEVIHPTEGKFDAEKYKQVTGEDYVAPTA